MKLRSTFAGLNAAVTVLAVLGLVGCGARSAAKATVDAGPDTDESPEGILSFDVVATLTPADGASPGPGRPGVPRTNAFTLVLDRASGRAIVGGDGQVAVVPAVSADGRTFQLPRFSVGVIGSGCSGLAGMEYDSLIVTVSGTTLQGQASGSALISCGDCQFSLPFAAAVVGGPDVTPPVLLPASTALPTNPFQPFNVLASEPLPATATARLVASDGRHVDLVPSLTSDTPPLVVGFSKPDVVLPYDAGFAVAVDGLVDFAGHVGSSGTPLRLTAFAPPPLVPGDGFESTTSATVGGATVISEGPVPAIGGTRSVYICGPGGPTPTTGHVSSVLGLRLAVPVGATKLRFSYETVTSAGGEARVATVHVGSVGSEPATDSIDAPTSSTQKFWPNGMSGFLAHVAEKEVSLPAHVTDEVVVDIDTSQPSCSLVTASNCLLIDDLRVE